MLLLPERSLASDTDRSDAPATFGLPKLGVLRDREAALEEVAVAAANEEDDGNNDDGNGAEFATFDV